ncbi:type II toxin-antitoxin system PemK/MazF family toxin [Rhizobium sp. NFR03]|uniref:type II toxin-antitoxin system PemK/MazF family toxin n=1 Tax=Rhizobium sp. NFR03 TaxID=1566263 RepID=UPI0008BE9D4E|nr:type II toxin-antitoxin system PemK/MazF family toxin [Rhizobium sp. NFR03]SES41218.1 PemK-like, MazF-like toxin of type II toxin-antitoxin system [Rhizobium sp. NFR03]
MLEPGDIVRFYYLWKRQADMGEESGRKARPVCVVVRTPDRPGKVFLFPITSQHPDPSRVSLAISPMECRRAGLGFPCWMILDEYNRVDLDKAFDFESTAPVGALSHAFLKTVAAAIRQAAASRSISSVTRS